ncbi:MAG: aminotransferase class I/II-fold pyridoxal phosphate-dependent enzyme [Bacteriovoracaceae bacterium]|nr:aminotransferase class I/II-fold pyridoxal phosphate-dependent enzyme [Bacteriovoracaceae bacterium]
MKNFSQTVEHFKKSIFSTMTESAIKHNAVNLSQGLPDFEGPSFPKEFASHAIGSAKNQSSAAEGILELRESIAFNYKKYYDLSYDPLSEITVTCGATEAIFSTILALVNPGDEVIVLEPCFDTYVPSIKMAGGKPVAVTLHAPNFTFDIKELERAFSKKTKLIIVNSPNNPSGKVFDIQQMEVIAQLAIKYDAYVLSDEVYEFLTYDGAQHVPMAHVAGLKDRTITISSTGKTFGLTGWRIGWAAAPASITRVIRMAHQNITFSAPRPLQEAMAKSLQQLDEYLPQFRQTYLDKRNFLMKGLLAAGLSIYIPQGTYFIMCPIPDEFEGSDIEYCMQLIKNKQVACIPTSAFYIKSTEGQRHIRFCFAKNDQSLQAAIKYLQS